MCRSDGRAHPPSHGLLVDGPRMPQSRATGWPRRFAFRVKRGFSALSYDEERDLPLKLILAGAATTSAPDLVTATMVIV